MYTFPFTTCEVPWGEGKIAQPFSFSVNLLSCIVLVVFLFYIHRCVNRAVLVSLLLFEVWHAFSHAIHLPGSIQVYVVHMFAWLVNGSLLLAFATYTERWPSWFVVLLLLVLSIMDIYAVLRLPFLVYFGTSVGIFAIIILVYYPLVGKTVQNYMVALLGFAVVISLLFVNETLYCPSMLRRARFPYHAILEAVGTVLFVIIGLILLTMERDEKLNTL